MVTATKLKEQIEKLEGQVKEISAHKMVYSKDRKFVWLTRDVDISEWLQNIGEFVRNRFGDEQESVMFLMDHLEKEARTEISAIVEKQPSLYKSRDEMIKHKFAEGVLDLGLR